MKSLLFELPLASRKDTPKSRKRPVLVYAVLGAVLCLVMPFTSALAQELAGTVSCTETRPVGDAVFVSSKTEYTVETNGSMISGRWGENQDTAYGLLPFGDYDFSGETSAEDVFSGVTVNFWTVPTDAFCQADEICLPYESVYSETGWWKFRVHKDQLIVRGSSFVFMDYPLANSGWTTLTADCTWNLSGPLPSY